jgi:four helix bundle protein
VPGEEKLTVSEFDHDRLDVYRTAIEFVVIANEIAEQLPRGRGYLADQLQRAATSIPLNIGEGAGEYSSGDKARFYRMGRRSATECAAILDVCQRLKLVTDDTFRSARELLVRIVSMLVRMVRSLESPAHAVTPEPTLPGTGGHGHGHGHGHDRTR